MRNFIKLAKNVVFACLLFFDSTAQSQDAKTNLWAYDSIHIPEVAHINSAIRPIVVAVVDDAFRLSHKEIKDFIYTNPLEIPNNQIDDDGNGYTDDAVGWDISDHDSDVSVSKGREIEFYHGTYISSIITKVASLHYGDSASQRIKIMPVKVLSDQANNTYLKDGYKGIKYAMDNGADIICLAWSEENPKTEDLKIIEEAHQKGILIVSSAGNFNHDKIMYPALSHGVIAVGGINMEFQKEVNSNFGDRIDISAPAKNVLGAHPEKDNAYIHDSGTSASAALVSGCAAILMSEKPALNNHDIKEALLNSSTPFTKLFATYGGKMGAGMVNLEQAIDYIENPISQFKQYSELRSKGSIVVNARSIGQKWSINPEGSYHGFYLTPNISGVKKPEKHSFSIFVNDTLWDEYKFSDAPGQIFIPAQSLTINMQNNTLKKKEVFRMNYYGKTIDSTTLYCSETQYLNQEDGQVTDGSEGNNYANNCSCKWIITVAQGKRIKFTFTSMDSEPNVDFVYLVDGRTAIPSNFIAKFSGQNLPPIVYSKTNEVLIWFVTDKATSGQGWQFQYETVK